MAKPFVKGDSRINRKGRPKKGTTMTDLLRVYLEDKLKDDGGKTISIKEAFIKKVVAKAINEGDISAIKEIWNRLEGMPVAKQEITGTDGGPLEIVRHQTTDS